MVQLGSSPMFTQKVYIYNCRCIWYLAVSVSTTSSNLQLLPIFYKLFVEWLVLWTFYLIRFKIDSKLTMK